MYYFLCSSLPSLRFGVDSGIGVDAFDELCREQMTPADFRELQRGTIHVGSELELSGTLPDPYCRYVRFEQYLRTWIAGKRTTEDEKAMSLPNPLEYFTRLDQELSQAAALSPLERERAIDKIRWREMEDLTQNEFDFKALCVYRLKLQLLEKYRGRQVETGRANFQTAVERISKL